MSIVRYEHAVIEIAIGQRALAEAVSQGIRAAIGNFARPPRYPSIRLRTFRRLEAVDVAGKIVLVRVTERGLRRLPALVEAIRARGALGVQLIWDGEAPPRDRAEPIVFRILEAARATKHQPPVVIAPDLKPVLALRALIVARSQA